jgi:chromate transporter
MLLSFSGLFGDFTANMSQLEQSPHLDAGAKSEPTRLCTLALLFLRLGATAFGGPAAHIAMMHDEVVVRRNWLSEERFLDLLGATNLIPGPNSTELAIHIGWERRRFAGLVVAGLAFIVPAMLITGVLSWVYLRFGSLPTAVWLLYGVKPVILGVVLQAVWGLAPKAARTAPLRALAILSAALAALGVNELAVLFGAGLAALLVANFRARPKAGSGGVLQLVPFALPTAALA